MEPIQILGAIFGGVLAFFLLLIFGKGVDFKNLHEWGEY